MKQKFSSLFPLLTLLILVACTPQRGSQPATDFPTPVQGEVEPTPGSSQATATPPTGSHIEHTGVTFTYDPTLLGDINIQDVPASADQGLFGMPTPAHTWFGFVPAGIQPDLSNHWALTRKPQIIIFNPNDFGSFATSDEMARANVALFQQMLAERPSTFNEEIPVLPLVNAAQMIRTQVRWLDFGSGTGLGFVTEYSQDNLPLINDRLLYIYYGFTSDGLHGVTAIFPLTNTYLPGIKLTGQENETPYTETFVLEKVAAITGQVNALSASDFDPLLSQLDSLVQSITITPTATDFPLTAAEPQQGQAVQITAVTDNPIYARPGDQAAPIGTLLAGEAVEILGTDETGAWLNIACPRGIGIACWVVSDTAVNEPTGFFAGDG